jgi:hypothetical protein
MYIAVISNDRNRTCSSHFNIPFGLSHLLFLTSIIKLRSNSSIDVKQNANSLRRPYIVAFCRTVGLVFCVRKVSKSRGSLVVASRTFFCFLFSEVVVASPPNLPTEAFIHLIKKHRRLYQRPIAFRLYGVTPTAQV